MVTTAPTQRRDDDRRAGGRVASGADGGHEARLRASAPAWASGGSAVAASRGQGGGTTSCSTSIRQLVEPAVRRRLRPAPHVRARPRRVVVPPVVAGHRRRRAARRGGRHDRGAAPAGCRPLVLLGAADELHLRYRVRTAPPTSGCSGIPGIRAARRSTGAGTPTSPMCGRCSRDAVSLPSTPNDPNTRDYPWQEGVAYRMRVVARRRRLAGLRSRTLVGQSCR